VIAAPIQIGFRGAPILSNRRVVSRRVQLDPPVPPAWVEDVFYADSKQSRVPFGRESIVDITESPDFALLRVTLTDATRLDDRAFRFAVQQAYLSLAETLRKIGMSALRFWNYLPEILQRSAAGDVRYESFNAGRSAAFESWFEKYVLGSWIATASAVGHGGDDMAIHVLAGRTPGRPEENPRQTSSYRYSRRYGSVPPCFARAVVLDRPLRRTENSRSAIVAGTASIVGEDTQHSGNLLEQLNETCKNLASVSFAVAGEHREAADNFSLSDKPVKRALSRYSEIRAYVVHEGDIPDVTAGFQATFPNLNRLEIASANLCRPDLLVEAEGIVDLAPL
jgi:chorismate lyase/3-hydroxybenzoate synthase